MILQKRTIRQQQLSRELALESSQPAATNLCFRANLKANLSFFFYFFFLVLLVVASTAVYSQVLLLVLVLVLLVERVARVIG